MINDLFVEQDGEAQPYVIPAWSSAIASIERQRLPGEEKAPVHRYTFPGPKIFCALKESRLELFLTNWLYIRLGWIGLVRDLMPGCELALKAQTWRDILRFGMGGPEPTPIGHGTLTAVQADMALCGLGVTDDLRTVTFANGQRIHVERSRISGPAPPHEVTWKNVRYNFVHEGTSELVHREVLWELHELNFRFDLIQLDACLGKDTSDAHEASKREDMLQKSWGAQGHDFYDPAHIDWPTRNTALADPSMTRRIRCVRYLHDLCGTWTDFPMPVSEQQMDEDVEEAVGVRYEQMLYSAIQQTFYDLFGRPMVPPRRLFPVSK